MGSNPDEPLTHEDEITVLITGFGVGLSLTSRVPGRTIHQHTKSCSVQLLATPEPANIGHPLAFPSPVSRESFLGDREVSTTLPPPTGIANS
jgi:hypothetical protein